MNITGKLVEIFEEQKITDKFKKREFVIECAENPQYPEYIKFELTQDKCSLISAYQINQDIDVHFNLRGRKWNDPKGGVKYFNTLQAWRITIPTQQVQTNHQTTGPIQDEAGSNNAPPAWLNNADDEDMPF